MQPGRDLKSRNDRYQEDDSHIDELLGKVSALKSITIEIGNEAVEQNRNLDSMQMEFNRLTVSLSDQIAGVLGIRNTHGDGRYLFGTIGGVHDGLVLLSEPTGTVLNSYGIRKGEKVSVLPAECVSLQKRGIIKLDFAETNLVLDASSNESYTNLLVIDVLKSNSFILKKCSEKNQLFGYRPGLRTKKMLESVPEYIFSIVEPDEFFSPTELAEISDNVVIIADPDGTFTAMKLKNFDENELLGNKV